jgi:hypothetical protein
VKIQRIAYEWAERTGRDPLNSTDTIIFGAGGRQVRVISSSSAQPGHTFFVRVENGPRSSHWCSDQAAVEKTLEQVAQMLEASQLAQALQ